ncbi:MAG: hypothetical protein ACFFCQ_12025 [Promethearchaeota archaeon]
MKGKDIMLVCLGAFLFSAIGYLLQLYILKEVDVTSTTGLLEYPRIEHLIIGLLWLMVSLIASFGAALWLEHSEAERVGMISVLFLLLWIVADFGIITGSIVYKLLEEQSVELTLDLILDDFFVGLLYALAPAIASCLGISNKR